jgi:hypothetical protein
LKRFGTQLKKDVIRFAAGDVPGYVPTEVATMFKKIVDGH